MGYDVHITRAEDWADNAGSQIATQEWLDLVRADPELALKPENGEFFAVWRGPGGGLAGSRETWFDWQDGNITTKYPDRAAMHKLLLMAERLNATVQGDDGEVYGRAEVEAFDDQYLEGARHAGEGLFARLRRLFGRR